MRSTTVKTVTKRRKRRWRPDLMEEVRRLGADGLPAEVIVHEHLAVDPRFGDIQRKPSVSTVRRFLADIQAGERWRFTDADDPDDALFVLESLAAVVTHTEGRVQHITEPQAALIARIRRARPNLRGWTAYRFALRYLEATATGEPTDALDIRLAQANPAVDGLGDEQWDRWVTGGRLAGADLGTKEDDDGEKA